jgi:ribosomal-protein-alanine N-acetyltransferase
VDAARGRADQAGADSMFLEVAVDNAPAIALYEAAGFAAVGRRPGYYDRGAAGRVDALILRLDLNSATA